MRVRWPRSALPRCAESFSFLGLLHLLARSSGSRLAALLGFGVLARDTRPIWIFRITPVSELAHTH